MRRDYQVFAEARAILSNRDPAASLSLAVKIGIVLKALRSHEKSEYDVHVKNLEELEKRCSDLKNQDWNYLRPIFKQMGWEVPK